MCPFLEDLCVLLNACFMYLNMSNVSSLPMYVCMFFISYDKNAIKFISYKNNLIFQTKSTIAKNTYENRILRIILFGIKGTS